MGLLSVLLAMTHYLSIEIGNAREVAQRKSITNEFKNLVLALHNFDDTFTELPFPVCYEQTTNHHRCGNYEPNLKPLYSWRFELLPFLLPHGADGSWDLAWDAPENLNWEYGGYRFNLEDDWDSDAPNTRVFVITGPGTVLGDGKYELPGSIEEAPADAILIVEVCNSGLHWMAPGDFDIRTMPQTINALDGKGISGIGRDGFHVGFVDGRACAWVMILRSQN